MDERHSCALGKQLIETDKCVLIILQICMLMSAKPQTYALHMDRNHHHV